MSETKSGRNLDDYTQQIADLRDWFKQRLPKLGKVTLTEDEKKVGVDSLTGLHSDLVRGSFVEWIAMRNYELSYNQTCIAYFAAASDLGLLEVTKQ